VDLVSVLNTAIEIFINPFTNINVFWTLIPVYLNWLLCEMFFEFERHNFQSAFSNGFSALWVGMDWFRVLGIPFNWDYRALIAVFMTTYGLFIMIEAARGKSIAKYVGRVREVTFAVIFLTPVLHGLMVVDLEMVLAGAVVYTCLTVFGFIASRVVPAIGGELADRRGKI
jgi:hypothetical protein